MRHGESVADLEPRRLEGNADFPLTERGRWQAEALAGRVAAEYHLDILLVSPLQRARQTAAAIARATGVPVVEEPRLRERSKGLLAGLTLAEADQRFPLPPGGHKVHNRPPEGESYLDQFHRVAEFWFSIYYGDHPELNPGAHRTLGIVAHGGTIQCLYHAALGLPPLTAAVFGADDTCLHEWHVEPGGRVVVALANCTRHLSVDLGGR